MICLLPLSKLFSQTIKILISQTREKVSNHRKCDSKDSKYRNTGNGIRTIHDRGIFVLHQEFIKSQQKNDDDAN
jgi:hypothetical protein